MNHTVWMLTALSWATVCNSAQAAAAPEKPSLAVMPIQAATLAKESRIALDKILLFAIDEIGHYKVIAPGELDALLGWERMREMAGCPLDSISCAAEIVGALGTRYMVTGAVDRLGSRAYFSLSLIDTSNHEVEGRGQSAVKDDVDNYRDGLQAAVDDLFERAAGATPEPEKPAKQDSGIDKPRRTGPRTYMVSQPGGKLQWARCVAGKTWNGLRCSGTRMRTTWRDATELCGKQMRLPTRDELIELLGGCNRDVRKAVSSGRCKGCSISQDCSRMFQSKPWPADTVGYIWSSTAYEGMPRFAWAVDLNVGEVVPLNTFALAGVRCVSAPSHEAATSDPETPSLPL